MIILGISAFYHDSSAAIIIDGKIVAAAQEERFSRIRHDLSFPSQAINFCLNFAQTKVKDLDFVVFYEKPFLKFERLLETYIGFAPKGFGSFKVSMPSWVKDKLFQKSSFKKWHNEWIARIKQNKKTDNLSLDSSTLNLMRSSNPLVIPRNHKVEEALDAANNNNLVPLHNLLKVLKKPYERPYKKEEYHITPPQNGKEYKTFSQDA